MSLAQHLVEYISACFTGLWIQSHEHDDALTEIAQMCRDQECGLPSGTWNAVCICPANPAVRLAMPSGT